jgi:uncharacterized protein DUF5678
MVGKWVLMQDDEIIEMNDDVQVLIKSAEKYQEEDDIVISKIPSSEYCYY